MSQFDKKIEMLKRAGKHLIPYNFPLCPKSVEADISALKKLDVEVDGYSVVIHYNKSWYDQYFLETFQVTGKNIMFLPFNLVIKLACKALGAENLSLIEFYQGDSKVYCWTVWKDQDDNVITSPVENMSSPCRFNGIKYHLLEPAQVNFH